MVETEDWQGNRENRPEDIGAPPHAEHPALIGPAPKPVSVRVVDFPAGTAFMPQSAPWGKFLFAVSGVVEFTIAGRRYLSPPAYALWIPPFIEHESRTRQATRYAAIYIAEKRCDSLPAEVTALRCDDILFAIVQDLAARSIEIPTSVEDRRLADVLIDRIRLAREFGGYLPFVDHPAIARIMTSIVQTPGDRRNLAQWAEEVALSERSLSRRWRELAGMSFHDWRQRAKLVAALTMLEEGFSNDEIARRLGYNSTSAYIAMVRQMTGASPERLRRENRLRTS
ncbi:helix-turn-helix transcriptional regulator [Trinickia sp. NRRL B-1857]|uniref:AraC family transcriptional regulator n=1 Tax=Trinickia sp. NRRL B-1857 TaxID=3162879 RepID=UPI003D2D0443